MSGWNESRQKLAEVTAGRSQPIAQFRRSKDPTKFWTIYRDAEGELWCDCPAWRNRHRTHGPCKHLIKFDAEGADAIAMQDRSRISAVKMALSVVGGGISRFDSEEKIVRFADALAKHGITGEPGAKVRQGVSRLITFDED